jgi:hypothetical protein
MNNFSNRLAQSLFPLMIMSTPLACVDSVETTGLDDEPVGSSMLPIGNNNDLLNSDLSNAQILTGSNLTQLKNSPLSPVYPYNSSLDVGYYVCNDWNTGKNWRVMSKIVQCALGASDSVTFQCGRYNAAWSNRVLYGKVAAQMAWKVGTCTTEDCRRKMSSCVLAHVSYDVLVTTPIDLEGSFVAVGPSSYSQQEGTYWGEIFSGQGLQEKYGCRNDPNSPPTTLTRPCSSSISCSWWNNGLSSSPGFGLCSTMCTNQVSIGSGKYYWGSCTSNGFNSAYPVTIWRQ